MENLEYILAHEKIHIKRRDNIWKGIGFLILAFNWFNPLVWISYALFTRDIEISCDERVIKDMGESFKRPYLQALIMCGSREKYSSTISSAFGKSSIKKRVTKILTYKKPRTTVIAIGIVLCLIAAVCFMTNPSDNNIGVSLNTEYYSYNTEHDRATVMLNRADKSFTFSPSYLDSFYYTGTYEEKDGDLILNVDIEMSFVFEKNGQNLVFNAEKSADIPKYKYIQNSEPVSSVPNKAVFEKTFMSEGYSDRFFGVYGTASADLDGNGIEETWGLGVGPTSGVCSVSLTAKENDQIKYETYFVTESENKFSLKTEGNKLFVVIKEADENFKEYSYEVYLINGQVQIYA